MTATTHDLAQRTAALGQAPAEPEDAGSHCICGGPDCGIEIMDEDAAERLRHVRDD